MATPSFLSSNWMAGLFLDNVLFSISFVFQSVSLRNELKMVGNQPHLFQRSTQKLDIQGGTCGYSPGCCCCYELPLLPLLAVAAKMSSRPCISEESNLLFVNYFRTPWSPLSPPFDSVPPLPLSISTTIERKNKVYRDSESWWVDVGCSDLLNKVPHTVAWCSMCHSPNLPLLLGVASIKSNSNAFHFLTPTSYCSHAAALFFVHSSNGCIQRIAITSL